VQCNVHGFATTHVSAITEHEVQGMKKNKNAIETDKNISYPVLKHHTIKM
jgi:uncharacterized protein (DUF362 family)